MADVAEQVKDKVSPNGSGDEDSRSGLSEKGKSVLLPAVATAATAAAARLAVKKGPDLMKKIKGEAVEEGEDVGRKGFEGIKKGLGDSGPAGKLASKLMGGGGGGGGGGGQKGGKTRRLPIQRWTDVAVPVNKAYEAWIQWEEWPKFMHRVLEANPDEGEDGQIQLREKIWFWTREWTGEITDQRKNDRIAWKTVSGMQHSGVVSFHKLDNNLTRVMVDMDFVPNGVFEKMASGMRFVKRAVQSDLARFKAYVEFGDAKEIEYKSSPAEMEQNQGGQDEDDDQKNDDAPKSESKSESQEDEDKDRDSEREERASRREERRKSLSTS